MKTLTTLAALVLLLIALPAPANAAETVHPEIEVVLEEFPDGIVLDYYEAYWPSFDMSMTVPNPLARSVGSCATGSICAYSSASLGGTKLSWGTCATHTIPAGFTTLSMANARAAGSVAQARNGTTIVASASSGNWTNVAGTVTNIRCLV